MSISPPSSIAAVRRRIGDVSQTEGALTVEQLDDAIQAAVALDYSRMRPRQLTVELPGDGPYIDVAALTGWTDLVSNVTTIEYPAVEVGSATVPPSAFLGPSEWTMYNDGAKWYAVLVGYSPQSTELVRVTFTGPHRHGQPTGEQDEPPWDTVPAGDLPAVLDCAAGIACGYLSAKAAHQEDGAILADGIQRGNASDRFRRLAEYWQGRFETAMGQGQNAVLAAASVTRPWPMEQSILQSRRGWLTH